MGFHDGIPIFSWDFIMEYLCSWDFIMEYSYIFLGYERLYTPVYRERGNRDIRENYRTNWIEPWWFFQPSFDDWFGYQLVVYGNGEFTEAIPVGIYPLVN